MSEIKWSGVVEEDMTDLNEEVFVHAGDRVYGNLNYFGGTPYIFGEIMDVDPEYVAPEFWVPVLPESIEMEVCGSKIPIFRLRRLAAAEKKGQVVILPFKCGDSYAISKGHVKITDNGKAIIESAKILMISCDPDESDRFDADPDRVLYPSAGEFDIV